MLTPAFHFKILESFLDVMNAQCSILTDQVLSPLANGKEFDVFPIVSRSGFYFTAVGKLTNAMQCERYISGEE